MHSAMNSQCEPDPGARPADPLLWDAQLPTAV